MRRRIKFKQANERHKDMPKIKLVSKHSGNIYEFDRFPVTVGRAEGCDLLLGGGGISKRHARIEEHVDGYHIFDLESLNGIAVNGKQITCGILRNNDEIQFGSVKLIFREIEPAKPLTSYIKGKAIFEPQKSAYEQPADEVVELSPIEVNNAALKRGRKKSSDTDDSDTSSEEPTVLTISNPSSNPNKVEPPKEEGYDEESQAISVVGMVSFRKLMVDLVKASNYELYVLSQNLDRSVFNADDFRSALFELIKKHRSIQVKVLIKDTRDILKSQHKILELYRRIPSNIVIKKITPKLANEINDNYIIFDNAKILHQPDRRADFAVLQYAPSKNLVIKSSQFLHVWEMSNEAPELRSMNL